MNFLEHEESDILAWKVSTMTVQKSYWLYDGFKSLLLLNKVISPLLFVLIIWVVRVPYIVLLIRKRAISHIMTGSWGCIPQYLLSLLWFQLLLNILDLLESSMHDVVWVLVEEVVDWGVRPVAIILIVGELDRWLNLLRYSTIVIVLEERLHSICYWIRGMIDVVKVLASGKSILDEILIIVNTDEEAKRAAQ